MFLLLHLLLYGFYVLLATINQIYCFISFYFLHSLYSHIGSTFLFFVIFVADFIVVLYVLVCVSLFFFFFVLLVQLHTPLLVGFVVSGVVVVYLLTCPNSRLLLMRKLPAITDVCVCV